MSDSSKAVFLSYASQDAEAAKRIADALRAAGVEVWFDAEGGLEHGDEWDAKIQRQIKECVLFIAVISANTQAREEGYFRLEWDMAAERARSIASGVAFILPVIIDGTKEPAALVPDRFRKVQWTKLPGGAVPPDVLQRFLKLWSHRTGALRHETGRANAPSAVEVIGKPGGKNHALVAVALALLLAGIGWWMLRPAAVAPATPAAPQSEARQLAAQARALIDDDLMAGRENFRLADEFSRRAVALDATDGEVWATAARVSGLILQNKYEMTPERKELAKIQVERANRLAPASIETGLAQASYLGVTGDFPSAERLLRQLIQRAPADKRLWRQLVFGLIADERFDDALGLFRQAAGMLDGDPRGESLRGLLLIRMGRYREAEAVLGQVLRQSPTKLAYSYQLVLLGFFRCDLPAASRFLEQIPPQLMQEDGMINLAAEIWLRLGEGDKALKVLQKSPRDFLEEGFEVRPKGFVVGYALQVAGRPTAAQAEWRQALVVMEKRLAGNPNQPLLLFWQGMLQALTGQKALALETRKLYRELETKPDAWFDAMLLVAAGENEQAVLGLLAAWPRKNFDDRSDIRGDLMYAPWLAAIRPDPRIQRLIAEHTAAIELDRAGPAAVALKADDKSAPADKSIAVLPFANLSEDKDNSAFFADGIQEDVLTNLGALHELRVLSRTSVAQYRGTTKPIRQIGEELHAAYVLEGSVRRAGKAVRVTGQLIRAATDEQVWSKSYDRDITDIFAVQSELAQDIARALQAALSPEEKASLARRPTESVAAYEAYLKARESVQKFYGLGRLVSAVALLQQAVELDPKFALAWAELGDCHAQLAFEEWDRTPARLAAARAAIETARRLAPDDPGVIAKLGSYYYHADRDYVRASEQYVRLTILRPNDPAVLRALGKIHIRQGRWAEGAAGLQRALELDPGGLDEAIYLVSVLADGRRYAEAEALARRLAATFPDKLDLVVLLAANTFLARGSTTESDAFSRRVFPPDLQTQGTFWRCWLARLRGDTREAIRLDRESPYWDGAGPRWLQETAAAVTLADAGDLVAARARATSALALMEAERPKQPASSWLFAWMGVAQALLGQKEAALASARHAMEILPESRDMVFGVENALLLAAIYARVGEKELALAEFARLLKIPHGANVISAARGLISANAQISFQPLWDDPRFKALLADPANNEPLF